MTMIGISVVGMLSETASYYTGIHRFHSSYDVPSHPMPVSRSKMGILCYWNILHHSDWSLYMASLQRRRYGYCICAV